MSLYQNIARSVFPLGILLTIVSCQEEHAQISPVDESKILLPGSNPANLVSRVTLRDGSFDNLIDHCSCTSLVWPVRVTINSQSVTVSSLGDLSVIRSIMDESIYDDDEVLIEYPVQVVTADYSLQTISQAGELVQIIGQCAEEGDDDDIECIDFSFPVTLSVYDTRNEVSRVEIIDDDQSFNDFLRALKPGDLVGIVFPLLLHRPDGSTQEVTNNVELANAIQAADGTCDEEDEDYLSDIPPVGELIDLLTSNQWKIGYYYHEGDQTSDFDGFVLTFASDGSATATNGVTTINGSWEIKDDDGEQALRFDFGGSDPWHELDEDFVASALTASSILFAHENESTLILIKL